jgi:hypothetical protein
VEKLLREVGMPMDVRGMVERNFQILGEGAVAIDRPAGTVIFASDAWTKADAVVVIPVVEGKATLESLKAQGAQAVEGEPDLVRLNPRQMLRRTPGAAMITTPGLAKRVEEGAFDKDYQEAGMVAAFTVEFGAWRRGAPQSFRQLMANSGGVVREPTASAQAGREAADRWVQNVLDGLESVSVGVVSEEGAVRVKARHSPTA